jgi:ABC-type phosphate/phosphonate transport system ATPase subunit
MSILEGGTVAVCGPRGAGKTTLLDSAARQGDLTVTIRVPAAYTGTVAWSAVPDCSSSAGPRHNCRQG